MTEPDKGPRIAVLVKQVPNIDGVKVDPATRKPVMPAERVMNTYDAYAVSTAIDVRERHGGSVTVVTMGPPAARDVLMRAMAIGADDAIHIDATAKNDIDTLATARILASAVSESFDFVLAGQSTDDFETGQVGPQVAELLGWPHVSLVTHIEVDQDHVRVNRDAEASKEVIEAPLPTVLMVLSGRDAEQRYPTLRGMMAAKKKPLRQVTPDVGDNQVRLSWSEPSAPVHDATGIILKDLPAEEAAAQLMAWLKERRLA
jgi:electron transfer flavoprotein beta subunit